MFLSELAGGRSALRSGARHDDRVQIKKLEEFLTPANMHVQFTLADLQEAFHAAVEEGRVEREKKEQVAQSTRSAVQEESGKVSEKGEAGVADSVGLLGVVKGMFACKEKKKYLQHLEDVYVRHKDNTKVVVRALQPEESITLAGLGISEEEAQGDCSHVLVGLDFDQTITQTPQSLVGWGKGKGEAKMASGRSGVRLRGGSKTRATLELLHRRGASLIVVTAQAPTISIVTNMAHRLRYLKLDHLFNVQAFNQDPVRDVLLGFGDNATMALGRLQEKLLAVVVLSTERYPDDCARIVHSSCEFDEATRTVSFEAVSPPDKIREQHVQARAALSGVQEGDEDGVVREEWQCDSDSVRYGRVVRKEVRAGLCLFECWRTYHTRTKALVNKVQFDVDKVKDASEGLQMADLLGDRLFFRLYPAVGEDSRSEGDAKTTVTHTPGNHGPFSGEALEAVMGQTLADAGVPEEKREDLLRLKGNLRSTEAKTKIARLGNLFAARYNKPECLEYFLTHSPAKGQGVSRIAFVDDSSDNVYNVFIYFAQKYAAALKQGRGEGFPAVCSAWYRPPKVSEKADMGQLSVVQRLAGLV